MRALLVTAAQGLGDAVKGLPILRAMRRMYPDAELGFATRHADVIPAWATPVDLSTDVRLWLSNPADYPQERARWEAALAGFRRSWDAVHDAGIWGDEYHDCGRRFCWPMPAVFDALKAGVCVRQDDMRMALDLQPEHYAAARAIVAPGEPYVAIASGHQVAAHWQFPAEIRAIVARYLMSHGIRVVGVAGRDGVRWPGAESCHVDSVRVAAAVIDGARLYVGGDTGTSWIAVLGTRTRKIIATRRELATAGSFVTGDGLVRDVPDGGDLMPRLFAAIDEELRL
jgi:hypothetical protein